MKKTLLSKNTLLSGALALFLVGCECTDVCESLDAGASAAPGTPAHFSQTVKDRVFFKFDESSVPMEAEDTVKAQASWLNVYGSTTATVEGHCDERGTREYNLALGARRANSLKRKLEGFGVASSRLKTVSYGKDKPQVMGNTEEAYAENRTAITSIN